MIKNIESIARAAGEIAREGFRKNVSYEYKTNSSNLVTEIDKKAEKLIIDFVRENYPEHGIIAEESGVLDKDTEYTWVIDPLDGTTNFFHGLPIFSVSIGLQCNGLTIAGVVYDVMMDRLYSAETGKGAFCNGEKISVSNTSDISTAFLVTGFPYDINENPFDAIGKFAKILKTTRGVRRLGSAAIDFCYLASGVFDGFWEVHLNPWDVCAGKLIVEEAGGKVTDFTGKNIGLYSKQILATNGKIHIPMIEILKD